MPAEPEAPSSPPIRPPGLPVTGAASQPWTDLWSLAEHDQVEAFVSAISFNNIYYIVRRTAGKEKADEALRALRDLFTPVPLAAKLINQSMDAPIDDFEDGVQFHADLELLRDV